MKSSSNGMVTKGIVRHMIPGAFFLTVLVLITDPTGVITWIEGIDNDQSVAVVALLILGIPVTSYLTGFLLSLICATLYQLITPQGSLASFGRLVYNQVPMLPRSCELPRPVRKSARRKIGAEMALLGWLDAENTDQAIQLLDAFWTLLLDTLCQSRSPLWLYWDRRSDLLAARQNTMIATQILSIIALWRLVGENAGSGAIIVAILAIGLVVLALLFFTTIYLLPAAPYRDMRHILYSYLADQIQPTRALVPTPSGSPPRPGGDTA